jgi:hypothetical protein
MRWFFTRWEVLFTDNQFLENNRNRLFTPRFSFFAQNLQKQEIPARVIDFPLHFFRNNLTTHSVKRGGIPRHTDILHQKLMTG